MSFIDKGFLLNANLNTREVRDINGRSISFYNTDKNISMLYMKLILAQRGEPQRELQKDEVAGYKISITAIKPKTNQYRTVNGVLSDDLVDETCAIFKFELDEEFTNQIGPVACWTKVVDGDKVLNLDSFAYDVNADGLTGLNEEIITDKDLPILEELIGKVQKVNNINDVKVSETETYSNKKIEEKFTNVDAQFNTIEQKKADKTEVDIERKRLDNIIANSNSTEGNSELVDIRIGADGTVYDCAGKAVREQFSNNNSKIQESASKNTEQDTRLVNIEKKNKVQDVYLNGLFNENNDGRLTINGEGNDLKLEGSKAGLVTIDSVTGNSLVNLVDLSKCENYNSITDLCEKTLTIDYEWASVGVIGTSLVERLKPNSVYTVFMYITKNTVVGESKFFVNIANSARAFIESTAIETGSTGMIIRKLTTRADFTGVNMGLFPSINNGKTGQSIAFKYMILEGDYTNKPIPTQVFTGIQSTFEDKKVTQEMVDAGTELASNLGKYKVPAKVVGKNKANPSNIINYYLNSDTGVVLSNSDVRCIVFKCKKNTDYFITFDKDISRNICGGFSSYPKINDYSTEINITPVYSSRQYKLNSGNNEYILFYYSNVPIEINIQIEEGTVATPFETYFESTHNIYLNSPLLKGDTLECRSDGVYHMHNMGKVVLNGGENWNTSTAFYGTTVSFFYTVLTNGCKEAGKINLLSDRFTPSYTDNRVNVKNLNLERIYLGDNLSGLLQIHISNSRLADVSIKSLKAWLQANPVTVEYQLAEPWEEKVSDNKFLCEIANGSTLYLDSNIPVQSMKATYTSNVVSVVKLDKIQYQQDQMNLDNVYRLTMLETTMGI